MLGRLVVAVLIITSCS